MKLALLLAAAAFAGEDAWSSKTFPAKGIASVRLEAAGGTIELVGDAKADAVQVQKIGADAPGLCRFTAEASGDEVVVKAENAKRSQSCHIGWRATAPAALAAKASSGSSRVTVRGMKGAVRASTGSGDVVLEKLGASIDAATGSGAITASELAGDFSAKTGSGDVTASFAKAPASITVATGSGDIELALPKGSVVEWSYKSGSGSVESAFGSKKGAPTKIKARAGSGDLKIIEGE